MTVKIRLVRMGKNKQPHYRIVVIDSHKKQRSKYLEKLGNYNPNLQTETITINKERLDFWETRGAQLSKGLAKLLS